MKVLNINLDGTNRPIHDAVYWSAGTPEFKALVNTPGCDLFKYVSIRSNPHMKQRAALIVFIHQRSRALMASMVEVLSDNHGYGNKYRELIDTVDVRVTSIPELNNDLLSSCRKRLMDMVSCAPNQGFASIPKLKLSCDQYRLCPWCRYKRARHIFDAFVPYLDPEHEVCVTHFMSPCDLTRLSINSSNAAYDKITKEIGARRDWVCDYLIPLPAKVRSSDGEYRLVWRTSLIAIVPKGQPLAAPEALAPKKIDGATMISNGVVYRYSATTDGLRDAFIPIMRYPRWMLGSSLTDWLLADMLTVLCVGDQYRSEPHGFPKRDAKEAPTANAS